MGYLKTRQHFLMNITSNAKSTWTTMLLLGNCKEETTSRIILKSMNIILYIFSDFIVQKLLDLDLDNNLFTQLTNSKIQNSLLLILSWMDNNLDLPTFESYNYQYPRKCHSVHNQKLPCIV